MHTGALLSFFIIIPLLASAFTAVIPFSSIRRAFALLIPTLGIFGAIWVLTITSGSTTVYADNIGGFVGGISIPIVADTLTGLMLLFSSIVALAANWFADTVGESRARFYPTLTLMLLGGAWGAMLTADLFNMFVFIEVMLMPSFGLIAMTGTWARLASARMFIVVNLITSLLLLAGVVLTYGVIGTTNIAALAGAAGPRAAEFNEGTFGSQWQLVVTLGVVILALSVKAGVAPVHTWLPRAYPSTSPAVMALFSGLHTKVAVYAILRIFMTIFEGDSAWAWTILAFMVAGMLIGGFAGLSEYSMRSIIGYQMVNGIPFMLIGLAFLSAQPKLMLSAGLFYQFHHMIVAAALILSAGAIEETYGFDRIRMLSGIMRRDPFVSLIFALGALAIVGFPPFSGLWGKLGIVFGIAADGSWLAWIALTAIVLSSIGALLSMVFVWREVFWGRQMNANESDPDRRVPTRYVLPSAAMMAISIAMFFGAGSVFHLTDRAANNLIDTTAYVESILPDKENSIGKVLPPGPSGLTHVPADAKSATSRGVTQEKEDRANARDPKQYDATSRRVDSPHREKHAGSSVADNSHNAESAR